jgi:hypothetical protein
MGATALGRTGILVAVLALVVMTAGLTYASTAGDWNRDVHSLITNPWGVATLVEIYVGLGIFAVWVCTREANSVAAVLWVSGILLTGNIGTALYLLRATWSSAGDARMFWTGKKGHFT